MARTGTMVEFAANGSTALGYLARSSAPGPKLGVVVIQEWWGLGDHIKDVTDRFAAAGFVALAPDLYGGRATSEPDEARKLAMSLNMEQAGKDMVGAVNYLCGLPDVGKIGVVGFCMGGSLALLLASLTPRIAATVSFYGGRPLTPDVAARISSPVLALYGGRDQSIPPEQIEERRHMLEQVGIPYESQVYAHAGHAFFNDTRPQAYDPAAAQDAWERMLVFFDRYLRTY